MSRPPIPALCLACLILSATIGSSQFTAVSTLSAARSERHESSLSARPLVHYPADQAAHPTANNEWWYIVGHLHHGKRKFGFETTFFKLKNVRAPGFSTPLTLYRVDTAITDESSGKFYQYVSYHFPQSSHLSSSSLNVRIGPDTLVEPTPNRMRLSAAFGKSAIDLTLRSRRGPMYVGGRGYLPFADGYTYYYELTDLASTGTLRVHGTTYQVTGISWLDHQWGNWSWSGIRGWTFMALQLNNGDQLSTFDFRSTTSRVRGASVLFASGRQESITKIRIAPTGSWFSPHTKVSYPSGWVVSIPALRASLTVEPTVRDQEVQSPGIAQGTYWEGSGRVHGTFQGKAVTGLSYTELTGYV